MWKGAARNERNPLTCVLSPKQQGGEEITAAISGKPITLQNPSADFNQDGWSIEKAIDSKTNTAWGIYPEVGKSHLAVFETKEDIGFEGGATAFHGHTSWQTSQP